VHCAPLISRTFALVAVVAIWLSTSAEAADLVLQELVDEALHNSPEILASQAKSAAAGHRVPQARSLPDPMLMTGYQNEGLDGYTYGDASDAQWMFGASQMFPLGGKLGLKGDMASAEAGSLAADGVVEHGLGGLDLLALHTIAFEDHVLLGLGHQDFLLLAHAG